MTWDKSKLEIVDMLPPGMKIEPLKGKDVQKVLEKACKIMEDLKTDYWLAAGTLLSLYRDGDFLPFDTDVDIECNNPRIHYKIVGAFAKNNMFIARAVNYDGKPMQRAFMDMEQKIIIDVYFYHDGVNYNDHGILKLPENYKETETYLNW